MDDSVLTMLARRSTKATALPEPSLSETAVMRYYLEAEAKREHADNALRVLTATVNAERAEFQQKIASLEARLAEASAALAAAQANSAALESRPPAVTRDDSALESLRAVNADLLAECALYKGRCQEMEKADSIARGYIARLEARESAAAVAPVEEPEEDDTPMNYDIEVVRGGDDKIRSLRVRCTE